MPSRKSATARKAKPAARKPKPSPPKLKPVSRSGPAAAKADPNRAWALRAAEAGLDKKAERPAILDVRGLSSYADYVVVLSADNRRQIEAVADEIEARLQKDGNRAIGREGSGETGWMLIDFGDVVVHLFTPETRSFYDLEGLWADAARIRL